MLFISCSSAPVQPPALLPIEPTMAKGAPADSQKHKSFVRNMNAGGKMHTIAATRPELTRGFAKTICGWYFRSSTGKLQAQLTRVASAPLCDKCFRKRELIGDRSDAA